MMGLFWWKRFLDEESGGSGGAGKIPEDDAYQAAAKMMESYLKKIDDRLSALDKKEKEFNAYKQAFANALNERLNKKIDDDDPSPAYVQLIHSKRDEVDPAQAKEEAFQKKLEERAAKVDKWIDEMKTGKFFKEL